MPEVVDGERRSIETHVVGMGQLLKERRPTVPVYQRSYSSKTDKEQCDRGSWRR